MGGRDSEWNGGGREGGWLGRDGWLGGWEGVGEG